MTKKSTPHSSTTTLHIRNMVCNRCIKVVGEELKNLGLDVRSLSLGEAVVGGEVQGALLESVKRALEQNGFELIEDRRIKTIERIKQAILKLVRSEALETEFSGKYSEYLARELSQDYHGLSTLFSSLESMTIEHYTILQKIERVKELLKYGELTLSEISYKLGYSSVAHLSNQFKKVTGMTPSQFKKMVANVRLPLDKVV
ncbi:MAG TPA: AraC family transcriptional regulator [Bacteroidota bacterium]|nr:AraC family transcriptional regulator [Bacteroidota bacterium]